MKLNYDNKTVGGFNYELVRGLCTDSVGAAELGECMDTVHRISDNDVESWAAEWTSTANRVSAYAQEALRLGKHNEAKRLFLKASNYYRMAVFYVRHDDPRHTVLWQSSVDQFTEMAKLTDDHVEMVEIPFGDMILPGIFVSDGSKKPKPTLIAMGGYDSTKEEVYCWVGAAAAEYGWNCLVFEGPGQWGALKNNPGLIFQPDYEVPMHAVVDYLETRSDVDADKLALIGYSMGGYLAPRAASGEHRIKACIPNTLVVDAGEAVSHAFSKYKYAPGWLIDGMFSFASRSNVATKWYLQHAEWTLGYERARDFEKIWAPYSLKGREELFTAPMLFLFSEDDIIDLAAPTPEIVQNMLTFILELPCEKSVRLFTTEEGASSHCQMGGLSYAHSVIFGWLNQTFDLPTGKSSESTEAEKQQFIDIFAKYGGEKARALATKLLEQSKIV